MTGDFSLLAWDTGPSPIADVFVDTRPDVMSCCVALIPGSASEWR